MAEVDISVKVVRGRVHGALIQRPGTDPKVTLGVTFDAVLTTTTASGSMTAEPHPVANHTELERYLAELEYTSFSVDDSSLTPKEKEIFWTADT